MAVFRLPRGFLFSWQEPGGARQTPVRWSQDRDLAALRPIEQLPACNPVSARSCYQERTWTYRKALHNFSFRVARRAVETGDVAGYDHGRCTRELQRVNLWRARGTEEYTSQSSGRRQRPQCTYERSGTVALGVIPGHWDCWKHTRAPGWLVCRPTRPTEYLVHQQSYVELGGGERR